MRTLLSTLFLLLLADFAFAAQDVQITSGFTLTDSGGTPAQSGHCTAELTVNTWAATPTSGGGFSDNACGMNFQFLASGANLTLQAYWTRGTGGAVSQFTMTGGGFYVIRFQVDPPTKTHQLDGWNSSCVNVYSQPQSYSGSSGSNSPGQTILGNDATGERLSWFRLSTDTFPPAQNCPTTAATGRTFLSHWKFEGNLLDSSGNGHNFTGGSPSYFATLSAFANLVVSVGYSTLFANAPSFTGLLPAGITISNRAGQTATWDGSQSFSETDAASTVTCVWQVLNAMVKFSAPTSCVTQVTALVFGDYNWQLLATDTAGNVGTGTGHIGAVGTDSNNVVVQANADADLIYGPMMMWGSNPWGARDALAMIGANAQVAYQGCCAVPSWATAGTGTTAYTFCGKGGCTSGTGTTTTGSMTSTQSTVPITNASVLDLSTLPSVPTTIWVGPLPGTNSEIMLICSTTGTSGAQTLTVCPNGRGIQGGGQTAIPATTHSNGDLVGQFKITGTSTLFESDPVTQLCPTPPSGYVTSPIGKAAYSTGTVTISGTTITGIGTSWASPTVVAGQTIVVWATTGVTTKFSYMTQISVVGSATSLTTTAAPQVTPDAGPFNYVIVSYRNPVLGYTRADTSPGATVQSSLQVCIGNLQLGGYPAHDYGSPINTTAMSSMNYSYIDNLISEGSNFTPTFYGFGLAARQIALSSGLAQPLQLANWLDNYEGVTDPQVDGGYNGFQPLFIGGGVIGGWASLRLDPNSLVGSNALSGTACGATAGAACNLRYFSSSQSGLPSSPCYAVDTRDSGYDRSFIATDAKWDTGSFKTSAVSLLESMYNNRDVGGSGCKQSDNSFSNAYLIDASGATPNVANSGYAPLNLTNGSATATDATGLGISADRCNIVASGTLLVSTGSAVATDSGNHFVNPTPLTGGQTTNRARRLIIHGTKNSGATPYVTFFQYFYNSTGSITLNGLWPGAPVDSCASGCSYVIENTGFPTTIGLAPQTDSADLQVIWACTQVNSSTITLDRPWTGATQICSSWPGCAGTVYNLYQSPGRPSGYGIGGYGQQPYMLDSMAVTSMRLASNGVDSASNCGGSPCDAAWLAQAKTSAGVGWNPPFYDPATNGIQYGVGYGGCEQQTATPLSVLPAPGTAWINGTDAGNGDGCQFNLTLFGIATSRGDGVEGGGGLWTAYLGGGITQLRGDQIYGSAWQGYTSAGFYDPNDGAGVTQSVGACGTAPPGVTTYKYFGFCFGMGMSHQWPAARLGGVLPANPFPISAPCVARYSGTATCSWSITAPNGVVSTVTASVGSSYSTTIDKRQGSVLITESWLNGGSTVLGTGMPVIVNPN